LHPIPGKHYPAGDDRREREQHCSDGRPADTRAALLQGLKLFRQRRVAYLIAVKVYDRDAHAVFHLANTEVVQERSPLLICFEVFSHVLGKQNVAGVATIHHPLRHVDAWAGDIGPPADVGYLTNWSAVNSHPHRNLGMRLERFGDLKRAARRLFRTVAEDQRHPIAGR
jgi:hypothetical protein